MVAYAPLPTAAWLLCLRPRAVGITCRAVSASPAFTLVAAAPGPCGLRPAAPPLRHAGGWPSFSFSLRVNSYCGAAPVEERAQQLNVYIFAAGSRKPK